MLGICTTTYTYTIYISDNDGDLELYLTWTPTWPTSSKGTLRLVVEMHSVYTVRNLGVLFGHVMCQKLHF